MNKQISAKDILPAEVTTGPLSGSRKVYASPEGHDDVRVPFREISLSDGSASSSEAVGQKNVFRTYDTSGPYTDPQAAIDVRRGLPPLRAPWIEERMVRGPAVILRSEGEARASKDGRAPHHDVSFRLTKK